MSEWSKGYYTGIFALTAVILIICRPSIIAGPVRKLSRYLDRQPDWVLRPVTDVDELFRGSKSERPEPAA